MKPDMLDASYMPAGLDQISDDPVALDQACMDLVYNADDDNASFIARLRAWPWSSWRPALFGLQTPRPCPCAARTPGCRARLGAGAYG